MVRLQHLLDPTVEALNHAVRLRVLRRGEAVFDSKVCTEPIELVLAGGNAFAQAEQAVGEFLAVVRKYGADVHRAGAFQVAQEPSRIGGGLRFVDADEDPAGRAVDGHEQVAARGFVSHLRQILHIDMKVAGLIGLECLVLGSGVFRLQIAQIANPMPPQTPVQPRARDLRVQELAHQGEQVVDRHQQRFAQDDRHRLLRRGQGRLQPVRCVAAVMHAVAMLPFVDGLLGRPEPLRQG